MAFLGGVWAMFQMFAYSHTQESVLDEGAYLYKGYLFVTGQYTIYQPYGPWSNHMPLAFLIPGYAQFLFGPGIRTGRYFSIFLTGLMLWGVWILARRLGNRWWAIAAVWIFAINPALLKMYSTAVSQGLIACMLTWTLVLVLGERRPMWQIALGSILAGFILMTRVNMLIVLPIAVLYIFWQHGKKAGMVATLAGGFTFLIGHALFWPGILQNWTRLPRAFTPFLDGWRFPKNYEGSWQPDVTLEGKVLSFFHSIRFHFPAMVGALAAWLMWPPKSKWKSQSDFRSAVFLSILFISLLLMHMWAALGKDYCVFCLAGYVGFFSVVGLLLLILTFTSWRQQSSWWIQIIIVILILVTSAGIGYGSFEETGELLYNINIPRWLLGSPIPGLAPLGGIVTNKYGLEAQQLRRLLPIFFGVGTGLFLLVLAFLVRYISSLFQKRNALLRTPSFGYWALAIFLLAGVMMSSTIVFGGGYRTYDCQQDVLQSYEAAGKHLAKYIPPSSLVYWKGTLSTVPLLYVPDIRIYPSQINDGYSMVDGDDLDLILKFGRWNEKLAIQWTKEADFILIEERSFKGWLRDIITTGKYQELEPTPPTVYCRDNSQIRIFKRLQ